MSILRPTTTTAALPTSLRGRTGGTGPGPEGRGDGATASLAMAALVMALSAADAGATLVLLGLGCEEVNPAMRLLLDRGPVPFLAGKLALTGLGCLVLVALRDRPLFRSPVRAGHLLPALAGLYLTLNAYQAVLLLLA